MILQCSVCYLPFIHNSSPPRKKKHHADHAALHDELPPHYFFSPDHDALSDDLTQLSIFLTGPQGTPYAQGLWRLHLKMPEDYPKSPPKAAFRTRIWHPNVEELTGAVCVDTLKRDWTSSLTLRDVLITISCLLIHPNPDSALNSTAGAMLQEDYDAFARQAKLMTSIHAPIPPAMKDATLEAKLRGEDAGTVLHEQREECHPIRTRTGTRVHSLTMKKKPSSSSSSSSRSGVVQEPDNLTDEPDDLAVASKENDPSLSPTPVRLAPPSPRKNAHGKRPLSVLSIPLDSVPTSPEGDEDTMTASEKNIAANDLPPFSSSTERDYSPQRKSPKLSMLNTSVNTSHSSITITNSTSSSSSSSSSGQIWHDLHIYEDCTDTSTDPRRQSSGEGKENHNTKESPSSQLPPINHSPDAPNQIHPPTLPAPSSLSAPSSALMVPKSVPTGSRKVSSSKTKPRIGLRRL
ncbi:hypothetical protein ASPZODRAFT_149237 [Penicilliopsis zonata CBS 506.65]|uniref:UBC core domain-containing protein n=1 Tax=Penicilliopsis zonata CBS 506.65 TaxID=1073090 RepID=A0A1L9SRJ8_9EURO|nr:hypothetical protein ASPZODRAFT_149237 [Penicilliopsis zonata CBS 506.65]OJJ49754.1 hypothetical protein ASPZODRAFT_149237 [Penicilliopsis zonata CBS 506.65]